MKNKTNIFGEQYKKTLSGGVYLDGEFGCIMLPTTDVVTEVFKQAGRALTYTWKCNTKQETFRQPVYASDLYLLNTGGGGVNIYFFENQPQLYVVLRQQNSNAWHYRIYWDNVIDGELHDFAVVIDYTRNNPIITAYRDGTSLGAGTVITDKTGIFDDTNTLYKRFGQHHTVTDHYLKGILAAIRIYNRALSADEIMVLCDASLDAKIDGCILDLPLDDGPRQFRDRSPNGFLALAYSAGVTPLNTLHHF